MKDAKEIFDVLAAELCQRVGLDYPPPVGSKYEVTDATWTETDQNDFIEWMRKYLSKTQPFKRMGKKYIEKEIQWFIFQYGWKCEEVA